MIILIVILVIISFIGIFISISIDDPLSCFFSIITFIISLIIFYKTDNAKIIYYNKEVIYNNKVYEIDSIMILTKDSLLINYENIEYR